MPVLFVFLLLSVEKLDFGAPKVHKTEPKSIQRELETEEIRKSLKTAKWCFGTDWVSVGDRLADG